MSLSPDHFFRGLSKCNVCDKELNVNDQAVTYHTYFKNLNDLIFCAPCATKLVMSMAQDIKKIFPEYAFTSYYETKDPCANLERHAKALSDLAEHMREWSNALQTAGYFTEKTKQK